MPSPSYHPAATAKAPSIHQTAPHGMPTTPPPRRPRVCAHMYYIIIACVRVR